MGKKMTALALAALLVLGLSGCGSGNNVTTDRSYGSRGTYDNGNSYNNGTNGNNGAMGNNGSYSNGNNGNGSIGGGSNGNGSYNGGSDRGTTRNGNGGLMGDIGDGIDDAMDDAGDAIRNAGDALTGDRTRYEEMLANGRVHDTDGYLLDGENRHD